MKEWWEPEVAEKFMAQARLQVTTDPHSPAEFRVKGPMAHVPAFAEAFGCEVGTPMHPEEQCLVW